MALKHFSSLMWRGLSADLMVVPAGGLLEALQTWMGTLEHVEGSPGVLAFMDYPK